MKWEGFSNMHGWKKKGIVLLIIMLIGGMGWAGTASAADPIELYTPLTKLAASPGQSVNYSVEVLNNTDSIQHIGLQVNGLPDDWESELKSGGYLVSEIAVKPGDVVDLNLSVTVPLAVQKGDFRFQLATNRGAVLPLVVTVTEAGTFRTELTSDQPNLEGASDASFTYTVKLANKTADQQTYALRHGAPAGWDVTFTVSGKNVSSVVVEPNATSNITVNVSPAINVEAGTYTIPIEAASASTGDSLELEAVITGTYKLELTTDNDLLSADITAGREKKVNLVLRNTGSSDLEGIKLASTRPSNWEVTFEQDDDISIPAGESKTITATIKASNKAIAGDYVVGLRAANSEVEQSISMRMSVKTSVLWGWIGILIVAAVAVGIVYLFRKYGRR